MSDATTPKDGSTSEVEVDTAFIEMLVDRMYTNPAIKCGIRYVWSGNQELAEKASTFVRLGAELLKEKSPWMSFDTLTDIYFYADYEQGLKDAADPGSKALAPTREVGGFSVGMHVRCAAGSKLVMHEGIAHGLLSDESAHNDYANNVLRHELCHVHDDAFKRGLAERDGITSARTAMEGRFLGMIEALWAEYFANKYSHGSWSDTEADFDLLRGAVLSVRKDVRSAIIGYRTSRDLEALLTVAESKVRFLTQCMGYAAGRLAGLGKSLEEHKPELAELLDAEGLSSAWRAATTKLAELDARRPDWANYWVVAELNSVGELAMGALGLSYRPHGDGLYVDVPETADTVPSAGAAFSVAHLIQNLDLSLAKFVQSVVATASTQSSSRTEIGKQEHKH